ncbi:MAG TPA: hypothetical protein VMH26_19795 [Burkholderiales bacterium]|nr:hypothetical protein [Burkholderiales bacterium]
MYKVTVLVSTLAVAAFAGCAEMDKMMGIEVKSNLIACPTKVAIGDVPSCGKVWKLASGSAELKKEGDLEVQVKGLVLNDASTGTANGTPDGVDGVAAAVVCGGKVAAQTDVVPLSKEGDATVKAKVSVPSDCAKPVVVLRERYEGKIGGWLAATSMP